MFKKDKKLNCNVVYNQPYIYNNNNYFEKAISAYFQDNINV